MRDIEIMMHVLEKCSHFCCCSILDNRAFSCHPLHLICSQWIGRWYYWDEENWNTKTNTWIKLSFASCFHTNCLLINVFFRFKQFEHIIISFNRKKTTKTHTHTHTLTHTEHNVTNKWKHSVNVSLFLLLYKLESKVTRFHLILLLVYSVHWNSCHST